MTLSKLIGPLLLLSVLACSEESVPAEGSTETSPAGVETNSDSTQAEPNPFWDDPDPPEIRELPPKWKAAGMHLAMLNPHLARETAPESFRVKLETTQGEIVIECVRAWAPRGVDRFYNLLLIDFYQDIAIYRVIEDFVVQFGMHGNPGISAAWNLAKIRDDPPIQSNRRGYVSFAYLPGKPNTRSTEIFINMADNTRLDQKGFVPIGRVLSGLNAASQLYAGYGEQSGAKLLRREGNASIRDRFPKLDWLKRAVLIE